VAAALGGVGAGFRLRAARLGDLDDEATGSVELVPPGAALPPGPRTRANVALDPEPGGAGDPELVRGLGVFGAPERVDRRPFSAADVRATVVDVAVERLKARGEPVSADRLLGDLLVGLDRAGQLRRLVIEQPVVGETDGKDRPRSEDPPETGGRPGPDGSISPFSASGALRSGGSRAAPPRIPTATVPAAVGRAPDAPQDQVERIVALIGEGMTQTGRTRLTEVAPGRWWLADGRDREAAAAPLSDRVEWAVFSLLSTAGPLSESSFLQRIGGLFGQDLPDESLIRACLESYRSRASTPDRVVTTDDLLGRAQDHAEILGLLADGGHRLGLSVWIGRREQARRLGSGRLGDRLDERERNVPLSHINRATEDVADVDCAWYARGKLAFLFEVEWTAMLGEPILKRHARIPGDEHTVRFLVIAPERTELVRHKLERSPVLREAFERDNWHVLKWNHLRTFLAAETPSLDGLEPFLGLDPTAERTGEQLGLFGE
jgi:hypothetical protein